MKASTGLGRLPELALRQRRQGLAKTASARYRNFAGIPGGTLRHLRKSYGQVCQGEAARADLVFDRYSRTWPYDRRHPPRGESGGSTRLKRELPQAERSPG